MTYYYGKVDIHDVYRRGSKTKGKSVKFLKKPLVYKFKIIPS